MRIMANNSGLVCCDKTYVVFAIISHILCVGCIIAGIVASPIAMAGIGFFYFFMLIFGCCMPATKYLCNLVEQPKLKAKIELALETEPDVNYYI